MGNKRWALDYVTRMCGDMAAEDAIKEATLIEAYLDERIFVEVEPLPPRESDNGPPRKPDELRAVCRISTASAGLSGKISKVISGWKGAVR